MESDELKDDASCTVDTKQRSILAFFKSTPKIICKSSSDEIASTSPISRGKKGSRIFEYQGTIDPFRDCEQIQGKEESIGDKLCRNTGKSSKTGKKKIHERKDRLDSDEEYVFKKSGSSSTTLVENTEPVLERDCNEKRRKKKKKKKKIRESSSEEEQEVINEQLSKVQTGSRERVEKKEKKIKGSSSEEEHDVINEKSSKIRAESRERVEKKVNNIKGSISEEEHDVINEQSSNAGTENKEKVEKKEKLDSEKDPGIIKKEERNLKDRTEIKERSKKKKNKKEVLNPEKEQGIVKEMPPNLKDGTGSMEAVKKKEGQNPEGRRELIKEEKLNSKDVKTESMETENLTTNEIDMEVFSGDRRKRKRLSRRKKRRLSSDEESDSFLCSPKFFQEESNALIENEEKESGQGNDRGTGKKRKGKKHEEAFFKDDSCMLEICSENNGKEKGSENAEEATAHANVKRRKKKRKNSKIENDSSIHEDANSVSAFAVDNVLEGDSIDSSRKLENDRDFKGSLNTESKILNCEHTEDEGITGEGNTTSQDDKDSGLVKKKKKRDSAPDTGEERQTSGNVCIAKEKDKCEAKKQREERRSSRLKEKGAKQAAEDYWEQGAPLPIQEEEAKEDNGEALIKNEKAERMCKQDKRRKLSKKKGKLECRSDVDNSAFKNSPETREVSSKQVLEETNDQVTKISLSTNIQDCEKDSGHVLAKKSFLSKFSKQKIEKQGEMVVLESKICFPTASHTVQISEVESVWYRKLPMATDVVIAPHLSVKNIDASVIVLFSKDLKSLLQQHKTSLNQKAVVDTKPLPLATCIDEITEHNPNFPMLDVLKMYIDCQLKVLKQCVIKAEVMRSNLKQIWERQERMEPIVSASTITKNDVNEYIKPAIDIRTMFGKAKSKRPKEQVEDCTNKCKEAEIRADRSQDDAQSIERSLEVKKDEKKMNKKGKKKKREKVANDETDCQKKEAVLDSSVEVIFDKCPSSKRRGTIENSFTKVSSNKCRNRSKVPVEERSKELKQGFDEGSNDIPIRRSGRKTEKKNYHEDFIDFDEDEKTRFSEEKITCREKVKASIEEKELAGCFNDEDIEDRQEYSKKSIKKKKKAGRKKSNKGEAIIDEKGTLEDNCQNGDQNGKKKRRTKRSRKIDGNESAENEKDVLVLQVNKTPNSDIRVLFTSSKKIGQEEKSLGLELLDAGKKGDYERDVDKGCIACSKSDESVVEITNTRQCGVTGTEGIIVPATKRPLSVDIRSLFRKKSSKDFDGTIRKKEIEYPNKSALDVEESTDLSVDAENGNVSSKNYSCPDQAKGKGEIDSEEGRIDALSNGRPEKCLRIGLNENTDEEEVIQKDCDRVITSNNEEFSICTASHEEQTDNTCASAEDLSRPSSQTTPITSFFKPASIKLKSTDELKVKTEELKPTREEKDYTNLKTEDNTLEKGEESKGSQNDSLCKSKMEMEKVSLRTYRNLNNKAETELQNDVVKATARQKRKRGLISESEPSGGIDISSSENSVLDAPALTFVNKKSKRQKVITRDELRQQSSEDKTEDLTCPIQEEESRLSDQKTVTEKISSKNKNAELSMNTKEDAGAEKEDRIPEEGNFVNDREPELIDTNVSKSVNKEFKDVISKDPGDVFNLVKTDENSEDAVLAFHQYNADTEAMSDSEATHETESTPAASEATPDSKAAHETESTPAASEATPDSKAAHGTESTAAASDATLNVEQTKWSHEENDRPMKVPYESLHLNHIYETDQSVKKCEGVVDAIKRITDKAANDLKVETHSDASTPEKEDVEGGSTYKSANDSERPKRKRNAKIVEITDMEEETGRRRSSRVKAKEEQRKACATGREEEMKQTQQGGKEERSEENKHNEIEVDGACCSPNVKRRKISKKQSIGEREEKINDSTVTEDSLQISEIPATGPAKDPISASDTTQCSTKPNQELPNCANEENGMKKDFVEQPVTEEFVNSTLTWTEKYAPMKHNAVIGNREQVEQVFHWLSSWKEKHENFVMKIMASKASRSRGKSDYDDSDYDDYSDDDEDCLPNTFVITGKVGCGSTATVYACAKELGYKVLEINPSSNRSGKQIQALLGEATQSHQVKRKFHGTSSDLAGKNESDGSKSLMNFFGAKPATKTDEGIAISNENKENDNSEVMKDTTLAAAKGDMSLILLEQADIVFDEQDRGFWFCVNELRKEAKRPIIITANDSLVTRRLEGDRHEIVTFQPIKVHKIVPYLQAICLAEQVMPKRRLIEKIVASCDADIRKSILKLQFLLEQWRAPWYETMEFVIRKIRPGTTVDACYKHFSEMDGVVCKKTIAADAPTFPYNIKNTNSRCNDERDSAMMKGSNDCNTKDAIKMETKQKEHAELLSLDVCAAEIKRESKEDRKEQLMGCRSLTSPSNDELLLNIDKDIDEIIKEKGSKEDVPMETKHTYLLDAEPIETKDFDLPTVEPVVTVSTESGDAIGVEENLFDVTKIDKLKLFLYQNTRVKNSQTDSDSSHTLDFIASSADQLSFIDNCKPIKGSVFENDVQNFGWWDSRRTDGIADEESLLPYCKSDAVLDGCYKQVNNTFMEIHQVLLPDHQDSTSIEKPEENDMASIYESVEESFPISGRTDHKAFCLDTLPILSAMCKSEDQRKNTQFGRRSRRFLHYLDTISLHLDPELCQQFTRDWKD